jgi:hypothetical protein
MRRDGLSSFLARQILPHKYTFSFCRFIHTPPSSCDRMSYLRHANMLMHTRFITIHVELRRQRDGYLPPFSVDGLRKSSFSFSLDVGGLEFGLRIWLCYVINSVRVHRVIRST